LQRRCIVVDRKKRMGRETQEHNEKDKPTLMVSEKTRDSSICASSPVLRILVVPGPAPLLWKDPTASTIVGLKLAPLVALPLELKSSLIRKLNPSL
jgi:hypothetical protein